MATFNDPIVSRYLGDQSGLTSGVDPAVLRYLSNRDPNALPTNQPPVIPEIAKAYVNDPRTQLALSALKTGTSTDPVARGKYGIADGIARALTAISGSWVNQQQEAKYAQQQQDLIESRRQQGQDLLTGLNLRTKDDTSTPTATASSQPSTGGTMPVAGAPSTPPDPSALTLTSTPTDMMAAALNGATAPPPGAPPGPGMAAGIPQGAVPPPGPPGAATGAPAPPAPPVPTGLTPQPGSPPVQAAPITGGSSQSTGPFSQGSDTSASTAQASPSTTTKPAGKYDIPQVPVPDLPPDLPEPEAPKAPAARVSNLLTTARAMMLTGNPYDSDRAQTMLEKGLEDQDTLNQAADQFANEVTLKQYGSKLDLYSQFKGDKLRAALQARAAAQEANYAAARQSIQNKLEADKADAQNRTTIQAANIAAGGELTRTRMTIAAEYGLERMKEQAALNQIDEKRRTFYGTPAGATEIQKVQASNAIARQGLSKLAEYQQILDSGGVGGGIRALASAAINPFDNKAQRISGLSNDLALIQQNFAKGSGRGSNLQLKTILGGKPGLDVSPATQQARVNSMRDAFLKSIDYNNAILDNMATGGNPADLERNFGAYEAATPVVGPKDHHVTFNEWMAAQAQKGATGQTGNALVDKYLGH